MNDALFFFNEEIKTVHVIIPDHAPAVSKYGLPLFSIENKTGTEMQKSPECEEVYKTDPHESCDIKPESLLTNFSVRKGSTSAVDQHSAREVAASCKSNYSASDSMSKNVFQSASKKSTFPEVSKALFDKYCSKPGRVPRTSSTSSQSSEDNDSIQVLLSGNKQRNDNMIGKDFVNKDPRSK